MTDPIDTPQPYPEIIRQPGVRATELFRHEYRSGKGVLVVEHQVDACGASALQFYKLGQRGVVRITIPARFASELHHIADDFAELERTLAVGKPRRVAPDGPALRAREPRNDRSDRT